MLPKNLHSCVNVHISSSMMFFYLLCIQEACYLWLTSELIELKINVSRVKFEIFIISCTGGGSVFVDNTLIEQSL